MPRWRNWYTRSLEEAVPATAWRFKSSPGHNIRSLSSAVRALRLHRRCRGFKSLSDHPFVKKNSIAIIIFLGLAFFLYHQSLNNIISSFFYSVNPEFKDYQIEHVQIGSNRYHLYVADDDSKRTKGLSYSKKLNSDEGMLFIFPTAGKFGFWMKDMNYSLDFIYLNNNQIVDTLVNITPNTFPKVFTSDKSADKVIELNAGEVARSKLEIGSNIDLNKRPRRESNTQPTP